MSRTFYISGESLVSVKGAVNTPIGTLTQLGLSDTQITVTLDSKYLDIPVNAWGQVPPEVQYMLSEAQIDMTLINFDPNVLETCVQLSMGGAAAVGQTARAGTLMGGGVPRFAAGNNYISLNIYSPVAQRPWRFYTTYLSRPPFTWPLGTERSIVRLNWRAMLFTVDPWNNGLGAAGAILYDHVLDN